MGFLISTFFCRWFNHIQPFTFLHQTQSDCRIASKKSHVHQLRPTCPSQPRCPRKSPFSPACILGRSSKSWRFTAQIWSTSNSSRLCFRWKENDQKHKTIYIYIYIANQMILQIIRLIAHKKKTYNCLKHFSGSMWARWIKETTVNTDYCWDAGYLARQHSNLQWQNWHQRVSLRTPDLKPFFHPNFFLLCRSGEVDLTDTDSGQSML